ncbi:hypothetical protein [Aquimarina sp. AU474]|uniref:hypothetical protein n=1 Tax=Aquimarina sp. AU474 TaxID=2108529 RepID=UPI000D692902|nr:hypothetical protein [Aquimarina sp. AU474]
MKKTTYIFLLTTITTLFSCSKNDDQTEIETQDFRKSNQEILDSKSFNKKGIQHNRDLEYLLNHLPEDTDTTNIRKYTQQILSEKYQRDHLGDMHIFNSYNDPNEMLNELFERKMINTQLFLLAKIDFKDLNDFEQYDNSIDNFVISRLNKIPELSTIDKEKYINFLSVLKHSFKFWDANSNNSLGRNKSFKIDSFIKELIALAQADSVTNLVSIGGIDLPYTTFDYVQSSYFRFNNF